MQYVPIKNRTVLLRIATFCLSLLLLIYTFFYVSKAHADYIFYDHASAVQTGENPTGGYFLFSSFSGEIDNFNITIAVTGNGFYCGGSTNIYMEVKNAQTGDVVATSDTQHISWGSSFPTAYPVTFTFPTHTWLGTLGGDDGSSIHAFFTSRLVADCMPSFALYNDTGTYDPIIPDDWFSFFQGTGAIQNYLATISGIGGGGEPSTSTEWRGTVSPYADSIYPTTSVSYNSTYYWNDSHADFSQACATFENVSTHEVITDCHTAVPNTETAITGTITLPADQTYWYTPQLIGSSSTVNGETRAFAVVSNPHPEVFSSWNRDDIATSDTDCSIDNISGCFQRALKWAFVPKKETIEALTSHISVLEKKPPFGYVTIVWSTLSNVSDLDENHADVFIETIDEMSPILGPLNTGITVLMYTLAILSILSMIYKMKI
jgi:hypothetical protein